MSLLRADALNQWRDAIRQIAALPYRLEETGTEPIVRVLLVTSRETRRWVVPKGNLPSGMLPHEGAAMEAEEEAGVVGRISPARLGSFRYRKRRRFRPSVMIDVDLFPLAVTAELSTWKEEDQRERRWFALGEAADAVMEQDLSALIRSFRAVQLTEG